MVKPSLVYVEVEEIHHDNVRTEAAHISTKTSYREFQIKEALNQGCIRE